MNQLIEGYITRNYYRLLQITKRITKGHELSQDLLHEVILQLYSKKEINLHNHDDDTIRYYITSVLRINWMSTTSPFYYKIRKESSRYQPLTDIFEYEDEQMNWEKEILLQSLEISYSELDFWRKGMIELYLVLGSVNKVSKHTGIPKSSIIKYVKESREQLKDNTLERLKDYGI
jgi:hydroxymethylpyrimidine pyrophosphatase-like HAD family hydrolase